MVEADVVHRLIRVFVFVADLRPRVGSEFEAHNGSGIWAARAEAPARTDAAGEAARRPGCGFNCGAWGVYSRGPTRCQGFLSANRTATAARAVNAISRENVEDAWIRGGCLRGRIPTALARATC